MLGHLFCVSLNDAYVTDANGLLYFRHFVRTMAIWGTNSSSDVFWPLRQVAERKAGASLRAISVALLKT